MFCRKCGERIEDDSVYCSACGAKVVMIDIPRPEDNYVVPTERQTDLPVSQSAYREIETPDIEECASPKNRENAWVLIATDIPITEDEPMPAAPRSEGPEPTPESMPTSAYTPETTPMPTWTPTSEPTPTPTPMWTPKPEPSTVVIDKPMKWYNFLIYFSLWAGGILGLIYSFLYIGNAVNLKLYWSFYGTEVLDRVYGVILGAVSAFQIYVRFRLAQYRENAPFLLNLLYFGSSVISALYVLVLSIMVGMPLFECIKSAIADLISGLIVAVPNYIYFKKRKHLFVN